MKRSSVRPSVCPVDRQQQRCAAGLLLRALRVGHIDRQQATALSSKCEQCHRHSRRVEHGLVLSIVHSALYIALSIYCK